MRTRERLSLVCLTTVLAAAQVGCDAEDDDGGGAGGAGAQGGAGGQGGGAGGQGGGAGGQGGAGGAGGQGGAGGEPDAGAGGFGGEPDAGAGGFGGEPDAGAGGSAFTVVYILDVTEEENTTGTPGVDVCGVSVTCDGNAFVGEAADLVAGAGEVCQVGRPECSADRGDPNAALDDGAACEAGSVPSDYVSIGVNGSLAVGFARDLRGCTVDIVENNQGATPEAYEVFICADLDGADCLGGASLANAAQGGNLSFDVPPF